LWEVRTRKPGPPAGLGALKSALKKILQNVNCAALLGGAANAAEILDHFQGFINVDAPNPNAAVPADAKSIIDNGSAVALTPVPDSGNFQDGQFSGPNFNTYIGQTIANYNFSQQLSVEMHEFIHASLPGVGSPGGFYAQHLADVAFLGAPNANPPIAGNRIANIYQIHANCGTALPPGY
jgi:hypothetical protein